MQKQRRFRSRPAAADEDNAPSVQTAAGRKKDKQAARNVDAPKKALLSFEDDEDAGPPVVVPKKATRTAAQLPSREERTPTTQCAAPGEYSAERLQELRQKTASVPGAAKPAARPDTGGGFKLSGSFKAAKKATDDRFEVNARDLVKPISRKKPEQQPLLPPPPRTARREGGLAVATAGAEAAPVSAAAAPPVVPAAADSDEEGANGFAIPTQDAIRRAKEKRERLRSAHLAPDYVPLGGAAMLSSNQDAAARLRGSQDAAPSRGSDSEGEPETGDDMRMQFVGGPPGRRRHVPTGGVFSSVAHDDGDEDEDEDDVWVRQQLQKAGAASLPQARAPADDGRQAVAHMPAAHAAVENPALQAAQAGQAVITSLQQGLLRQQERQQNLEKQRKQTEANLEDALKTVEQLQLDVETVSQRYTYLQETRTFISDMCDMLQEKAPIVEVLEERLHTSAAERASASAVATEANDAEELNAAQAAIGAAIGVLSRDGKTAAAQAAAESAAEEADEAALRDLPQELDEFGRDANVERRRQAEDRMQKRRQQAAAASGASDAQPDGGSSDEDEGEVARFDRERAQIIQAAATVFADTSDEFSSVEAVKKRLLDWQTSYPATYRDAYMAISAPAIFAPFVRLQLLSWDPLHQPSAGGFDQQTWYQQLFDFSAPPDAGGEEADVVPVLVRDIIAPLALAAPDQLSWSHRLASLAWQMAEKVWKPASRAQTRGLAGIVESLLIYVPPEDQNLQALLKVVQRRLSEAVAGVEVPRWPSQALVASPRASRLVARQFSRAVRLLAAVGQLQDVLDRTALQKLAEQLLQQKIVPHLRATTNDVPRAAVLTKAVVDALPSSWKQNSLPREASHLQSFVADLHRRTEGSQRSNPADVQLLAKLLTELGNRRS